MPPVITREHHPETEKPTLMMIIVEHISAQYNLNCFVFQDTT